MLAKENDIKNNSKNNLPENLPEEDNVTEVENFEKRKIPGIKGSKHRREKKKSRGNILKYIIIILLMLGIVYFAMSVFFSHGSNVTTGSTVKQIELENTESYAFEVFGKNIVLCNSNGITAFDKNGNEKWNIETAMYNPFIDVSGDNMLITDSARSSAVVVSKNGKVKTNIDFGAECIAASVNKSGWTTAIISRKGYKACVSVFDSEGKLKYSWESASNDVISAKLAEDNKTLAVALLDSSSSFEANGIISLFDITTEGKPFSGTNTENNVVTYIRWSGKQLVCVGNKETFKIDSTGKKIWSYDYPGEIIMYNAESDNIFVFAVNSNTTTSSKSALVYTVNDDGKELGKCEITGEIKNLKVSGSNISAITSDKIFKLKKNASIKSECSLNRDVSKGYILDDGAAYLVVSGSSAEFLSLK